MHERVIAALEEDGIAVVHGLLSVERLEAMRRAFEVRLRRMRWNDFDGFEKTERYRHMVQDVLTMEQGFVEAALHPVVKAVLRAYLGDAFQLVEAKGWKSLPTRKDFHGWHGDAWYDQSVASSIPREVKLGLYLTDVESGAFNYVRGSHRREHPRPFDPREVAHFPPERIVEVKGPAGTAFVFDTSGIHRQGIPILEPRLAVFFNYHDPSIPLQREDVEYYRYHPLLLNAAFLDDLCDENRRILGLGDRRSYRPAFERAPRHEWLQRVFRVAFEATLRVEALGGRVAAGVRRMVGAR